MISTLEVGDELEPLRHTPTNVQLFRYSGVTWNAHRIHYDQEYAGFEGHPGVLVHSHLHAALMLRLVDERLGHDWSVTSFTYRLRNSSIPGTELTETARVTAVNDTHAELTVVEYDDRGNVCMEGTIQMERTP